MSRNFWADKRVLITGAAGFVGKHLSEYLKKQGARVVGLARSAKDPGIKAVNVANRREIASFFKKFSPEVCFHLAAAALVEEGQEKPYETFRNNLLGTLNILELSRLYQTSRVIIASTVHVYGDSPLPYNEDQPPRPSRPYETSKTCADLLAQSYADSFHLPVLIPRFVNIYGPGDLNFNRVIPKTIRSLLFRESPTIWDGKAQREYLYISDAVSAYDLLAQMTDKQIEKNRIYNFGTGELTSVSELMQSLIQLSGIKTTLKHITPARPHELPKQLVSFAKARRVLGWKPQVKLSEGLKLTLAWYRNYFKMEALSPQTLL